MGLEDVERWSPPSDNSVVSNNTTPQLPIGFSDPDSRVNPDNNPDWRRLSGAPGYRTDIPISDPRRVAEQNEVKRKELIARLEQMIEDGVRLTGAGAPGSPRHKPLSRGGSKDKAAVEKQAKQEQAWNEKVFGSHWNAEKKCVVRNLDGLSLEELHRACGLSYGGNKRESTSAKVVTKKPAATTPWKGSSGGAAASSSAVPPGGASSAVVGASAVARKSNERLLPSPSQSEPEPSPLASSPDGSGEPSSSASSSGEDDSKGTSSEDDPDAVRETADAYRGFLERHWQDYDPDLWEYYYYNAGETGATLKRARAAVKETVGSASGCSVGVSRRRAEVGVSRRLIGCSMFGCSLFTQVVPRTACCAKHAKHDHVRVSRSMQLLVQPS